MLRNGGANGTFGGTFIFQDLPKNYKALSIPNPCPLSAIAARHANTWRCPQTMPFGIDNILPVSGPLRVAVVS